MDNRVKLGGGGGSSRGNSGTSSANGITKLPPFEDNNSISLQERILLDAFYPIGALESANQDISPLGNWIEGCTGKTIFTGEKLSENQKEESTVRGWGNFVDGLFFLGCGRVKNVGGADGMRSISGGGVNTPNLITGQGYGASDTPVRIEGEWSINDMKQALLGHSPKGLGNPDLHHGGQMPGAAKHEIIPGLHRNNSVLHSNKYNQGVTPKMRIYDKNLHWWYRAREQGAYQLLPDCIYDN